MKDHQTLSSPMTQTLGSACECRNAETQGRGQRVRWGQRSGHAGTPRPQRLRFDLQNNKGRQGVSTQQGGMVIHTAFPKDHASSHTGNQTTPGYQTPQGAGAGEGACG